MVCSDGSATGTPMRTRCWRQSTLRLHSATACRAYSYEPWIDSSCIALCISSPGAPSGRLLGRPASVWPRFRVSSFGPQDRGDIEAATCFGQGHGLPVRLGGQVWAGTYTKVKAHELFMQMMGGVAEGRGA